MLIALATVIITLLAIIYLLTLGLPAVITFLISVLLLYLSSKVLQKFYKIEGQHGLLLVKTKKGTEIIDVIAKNSKLWTTLADIGLATAYGVLSIFLMRKHFSWPKFIAGIILLTIISSLVAPVTFPMLLLNISGDVLSDANNKYSGDSALAVLNMIILYGTGWFGVILFNLVTFSITILEKLVLFALGQGIVDSSSAGAMPIIPGINLPLFEGIIALIVILLVHEGGHAILTRIAKVPLDSSGIALFGVIPVGAFIEPDEEKLKKKSNLEQTRVLIAGSTANLFTALICLLLLTGFLAVTADYKESGWLITTGELKGITVYAVNGIEPFVGMKLNPNSEINLQTEQGDLLLETNEDGKIGITFYDLDKSFFLVKYGNIVLNFIYTVLGLTVALNFVIGVINILPIPLFDGYRLLEINVKNKLIVKIIGWIALVGLIINFVPLLF